MTEEIYGQTWQDNVVALAVGNSEITMTGTDNATLQVYVVFGGSVASELKDNSNFTFAIETTPTSTVGGDIEVGTNTGIITTSSATAGTCVISVSLTGHEDVPPALATVTVVG